MLAVDPELFADFGGSTDSEVVFRLALTFGLEEDPVGALERALGFVEATAVRHGVENAVQGSFGLSDGWDLLVTLRFGLERDFHLHRTFAAMPGFRYWVDRDRPLRLFTTLQLVYDHTNQNGNVATDGTAISDEDLGFRNANGFMYDVLRNFSLYFQFGETIAFKRWFRFEMDGGFGLQARIP